VSTTVTVKGQVTLPKQVRDSVGIAPGDRVDVRATASGAILIAKAGQRDDYKARLYALAKRRIIRGITTDEAMKETRGDHDNDPGLKDE
jgi:AbrB family looped-hinge helix DNA binding protein